MSFRRPACACTRARRGFCAPLRRTRLLSRPGWRSTLCGRLAVAVSGTSARGCPIRWPDPIRPTRRGGSRWTRRCPWPSWSCWKSSRRWSGHCCLRGIGYPYADVADVAGKSEAACRQALHRARQHLRDSPPLLLCAAAERDRLAGRFFAAVRDGDLAGLEAMLSDDVVFYGDGGGQAPAVREPVRGPRVARFVLGLARQARRLGIQLEPVQVNGQPGARALAPDGTIQAVLSLDISDSRVGAIYNQINPGKLSHLAARTPRIEHSSHPRRPGHGRSRRGP